MAPLRDIPWVLNRLKWLREQKIWPNGLRYLWTDACGVMLLTSLFHATGNAQFISEAETIVADVDRKLGRPRGIRIGEEPDRDGQYMHYLTLWMSALARLGEVIPSYTDRGIALAKDIHPSFVIPGRGIWWKMKEDLSGPYPGYGLGGLDPYDGLLAYTLLDRSGQSLVRERADMRSLIQLSYPTMACTQDLGLGMLLRVCSFFPAEEWARSLHHRSAATLDRMWVDTGEGRGYFSRSPWEPRTKLAFSNYGASVGIQCAGLWPDRTVRLNTFFEAYRAGDEYDDKAITWVMACTSHFPGVLLPDEVSGLAKRSLPLPGAVKEGSKAQAEEHATSGQPSQSS